MRLNVIVNGTPREADGVWEGESLLTALREHLDLPGSKNACEQGECGSCSVYLDGELVCSCLVLAAQAEGREVVTVEGIAPSDGELHEVQRAFVETGGVQCGFCTPGLIVASHDLLRAIRARATRRSARRSPATSAAARATRRSSTPCGSPPSGWSAPHDAHRHRGLRDRDDGRARAPSTPTATS